MGEGEQRFEGNVIVNLLPLHLQKTGKLWTKIRSKDLWVGVLLLLPLESEQKEKLSDEAPIFFFFKTELCGLVEGF